MEMSDQVPPPEETRSPVVKTPLIFISHDTRDAELAEAFAKLLSSVSAGVLKSFRSSDRKGTQGIDYGVEWYPELMSKLDAASDVVCLLTENSLERPWILYEAGVAKGKLNTPVYGIALGIPLSRAFTGPFQQFQNSDDDEDSLTKLVMQLVRRIPGAEPDREAILMQVRTFKERVAPQLLAKDVGTNAEVAVTDDAPSVAKLFEEVKVMFQDLPGRIEHRVVERPAKWRRLRRVHPMMIHELSEMISDRPGDPIAILLLASFFRDDMPWLYELGLEAYQAARSNDPKSFERAMLRFRRGAEVSFRGPLAEGFGISPRESHGFFRELPRFVDHIMEEMSHWTRAERLEKKAPDAAPDDANGAT